MIDIALFAQICHIIIAYTIHTTNIARYSVTVIINSTKRVTVEPNRLTLA